MVYQQNPPSRITTDYPISNRNLQLELPTQVLASQFRESLIVLPCKPRMEDYMIQNAYRGNGICSPGIQLRTLLSKNLRRQLEILAFYARTESPSHMVLSNGRLSLRWGVHITQICASLKGTRGFRTTRKWTIAVLILVIRLKRGLSNSLNVLPVKGCTRR